ncbi:unnamed protein product [Closterium sp. NIES-54]
MPLLNLALFAPPPSPLFSIRNNNHQDTSVKSNGAGRWEGIGEAEDLSLISVVQAARYTCYRQGGNRHSLLLRPAHGQLALQQLQQCFSEMVPSQPTQSIDATGEATGGGAAAAGAPAAAGSGASRWEGAGCEAEDFILISVMQAARYHHTTCSRIIVVASVAAGGELAWRDC